MAVFRVSILIIIALSAMMMACGPTATGKTDAPDSSLKSEPMQPATPVIQDVHIVPPKPESYPADEPPKPTWTPLPPEPTAPPFPKEPEPPYVPPPSHPEGRAGCIEYGLFNVDPGNHIEYTEHCMQSANDEADDNCSGLDGLEAQLACGTKIASEYRSLYIREGVTRCYAINKDDFRREKDDCLVASFERVNTATDLLHVGWNRVRAAGDAAPGVVQAMENVVTCLKDMGHADAHPDHLFLWQRFEHPVDYHARVDAQTPEDKAIKERLHEPSKGCANEHGLFEAQDASWQRELERLAQEEPDVVDVLIREGFLVHLYEPGPAINLTGEIP